VAQTQSPTIVRDPKVLGGEPTIQGTRVPVRIVVLAWRLAPDLTRICRSYPRLIPAAVQAALDYYAAHRAEIDRYIAENDADLDLDESTDAWNEPT
jgi:uncharacterized protein (DUF433 family)